MGRKLRPIVALAAIALPATLVMLVPSGSADSTPMSAPDWIGQQLTLNTNVIALSSPESTREELPGLGHKFELIGTMVRDADPENPVGNSGGSGGGVGGNEVISSTSTPGSFGLAFRNLPPGIKITALENQLNFKSFYAPPRTCGGGSPRISLFVDADGDGDFDQDPPIGPNDPADSLDFVAQGHVNPPAYTACAPNEWRFDDLADDMLRWEITACSAASPTPLPPTPILPPPFTCPFPFNTWDTLETVVTATFPNHRVIAGALIDDSCFGPGGAACGKAYFDLVTIENRTLEIWQDTVTNR
jgi:hypothetical protein